jgi:hypothetical protein
MSVIEEIRAERERQIDEENWTAEHDDKHEEFSLSMAGACYAAAPIALRCERIIPCGCREAMCEHEPFGKKAWRGAWPWEDEWWKPKDCRRDLIRAGALIVAEIERLDRAGVKPEE